MPLSLVKKAAARCGLALVTLVLAPLAGLVFGLLLAVAFLFGKGGEESGSALGGREEFNEMIEALPERELRSLRLLSTGFYGVQKVGRVILIEYEVEGWVCYPDFFGAGDLRTVARLKRPWAGGRTRLRELRR